MFTSLFKPKQEISKEEMIDNLNYQIGLLKEIVKIKEEMLQLKEDRIAFLEQALNKTLDHSSDLLQTMKSKIVDLESAVIDDAIQTKPELLTDEYLEKLHHQYQKTGQLFQMHPTLSGFWSEDKELFKKLIYKGWNSIK